MVAVARVCVLVMLGCVYRMEYFFSRMVSVTSPAASRNAAPTANGMSYDPVRSNISPNSSTAAPPPI